MTRLRARGIAVIGTLAILIALGGITAASAGALDISPPTEPGTITVSSVTSSGASLKWGGSTDNVGIEGYRVYRGPQGGGLSLIATTDAVTSYSATYLRSGYAYQFGVVAIDASDNQSPMRTTTLTTATSTDTTAPSAPSSTSVNPKAFSSTRIDVVWGASSSTDVAYYQVYRDGVLVGTVDLPNSPRFSNNGLNPSTSHSYQIIAVDSAGNHSSATSAKSTSTTATGVVKIARGPYLSDVTATSAVVSWWTNIATGGAVAMAGQNVIDPAGSVRHHSVTVAGLSPDASYPYTVSSNGVTGSGTLRTTASPGQTFSFAAIGDFGGGSSGETQNATNIASAGTQFIQTLGDNIYPSAGLPDPNFSTTYSDFDVRFYKPFGPAVKSQAFFPANGNKEYYGDGEFWANFPMPGTNHSWYSYNWGGAHILVLDSEQPFATGTAQYNFAQSDLAAHQGDAWRIVALQRPPYSSTSANSSSVPVKQYLVPLFQSENVNLVLSGNSHNYERTYPLVNGTPTAGGITYVVSGAGGNGFNVFSGTAPAYTAFRESSYYEYAKVTVSPSALTVDAVQASTNSVFDTTTITKSSPDTTPPSAPTGLTAGTPTASSVPLSWAASTDNVGVTRYNILRDGNVVGSVSGSTTSYSDNTVKAGTTYKYTVEAADAAGNVSPQSAPVTVTTPSTSPPPPTPALVQSIGATESSSATSLTGTFLSPTTSGHLLVLSASVYTGATNQITSVTDSGGNTWTRVGSYSVSGHNSDGELWYSANAKSVTTVTVNNASATFVAFEVQEFSGVATTSPLDTLAGTSNTSSSASSGSATSSVANELAVGFVAGHGNSQPITVTASGYTAQPQQTTTGTIATVVTGYKVLPTTGTQGFSSTFGTAMYWASGIAIFKPGS